MEIRAKDENGLCAVRESNFSLRELQAELVVPAGHSRLPKEKFYRNGILTSKTLVQVTQVLAIPTSRGS